MKEILRLKDLLSSNKTLIDDKILQDILMCIKNRLDLLLLDVHLENVHSLRLVALVDKKQSLCDFLEKIEAISFLDISTSVAISHTQQDYLWESFSSMREAIEKHIDKIKKEIKDILF